MTQPDAQRSDSEFHLGTERVDKDAPLLDELDESQLFTNLLNSQSKAIQAVSSAQDKLCKAISAALKIMKNPKSRLIYCGAGTSGRVALLDGVELNPTFNWPDERIHILSAGGPDSIFKAREGAEDDCAAAISAVEDIGVGDQDVFVGLAASGTTPFVIAALDAANRAGALTIGISSNSGTPVLTTAQYPVLLETGPEALAGSTRLAAGTSQKIALNIFSTALMVGLGKVYRGRMVDMRVTNAKLEKRAIGIITDIVGCDEQTARAALDRGGMDVKRAVLIARGASEEQADALLSSCGGRLADADRAFMAQRAADAV